MIASTERRRMTVAVYHRNDEEHMFFFWVLGVVFNRYSLMSNHKEPAEKEIPIESR
jgi:hypothetical protein